VILVTIMMAAGTVLRSRDEPKSLDVMRAVQRARNFSLSIGSFVKLEEIRSAKERIAGVAVRTPLYRVERARLKMGKFPEPQFDLYIKAESEQPIGSFKLRGAYNMVAQLSPEALRRGVITYSSGNHAQGVAYAARALGAKAVIVMPSNAPEVKKAATRALGAEIVEVGPASSERRLKAEELVAEFGYAMIPPYDAAQIIAGQATCGLEIVEQLPGVELVISPVSGGGLLSGIATAVKLAAEAGMVDAGVKVWGAEPELAADAKESFYSKTLVEWPATKTTRTIGDGLRTQSLGVLNFAHVLRFVDGIVTVSEEEILAAMRVMLSVTKLVPEPSGAVTLAAALFHAEELPKVRKVAVVLSGGNLEPALREQLEAELTAGRV
jgi:threonine dehydratase